MSVVREMAEKAAARYNDTPECRDCGGRFCAHGSALILGFRDGYEQGWNECLKPPLEMGESVKRAAVEAYELTSDFPYSVDGLFAAIEAAEKAWAELANP